MLDTSIECIPVLLTAFHENGSVDFDGIHKLLDYYYENGIKRLWVLGTGGEDMALSFEQRMSIVNSILKYRSNHFELLVH